MYNMFAVSVYSVSDCQSFELSQGDSRSHAQRYVDCTCNYTCQTIMPLQLCDRMQFEISYCLTNHIQSRSPQKISPGQHN